MTAEPCAACAKLGELACRVHYVPEPRGRTISEAVALALEALPGRLSEWLSGEPQLAALRAHVALWVHEYAIRRGVILEDRDVADELEAVISNLRGGR